MPFTSSPLGEYPRNPLAVDIFAANLPLAVLAVLATRAMFVLDAGGACFTGAIDTGTYGHCAHGRRRPYWLSPCRSAWHG